MSGTERGYGPYEAEAERVLASIGEEMVQSLSLYYAAKSSAGGHGLERCGEIPVYCGEILLYYAEILLYCTDIAVLQFRGGAWPDIGVMRT
eukprot:3740795-Rhodomonas_salina.1